MYLPSEINDKLNELQNNLNNEDLKKIRENLTYKYKNTTGQSKDLISSISRMPATYSVLYTLISELIEQGYIDKVSSIFDVGSGTGSGYFACSEIFENANISLFERNENMIEIFDYLSSESSIVNKFDLIKDNFKNKTDFVMSSYVLSELAESDRQIAFKKLLDCSNKYVLIVDTGTPETYKNMMKLKEISNLNGYHTIAPCFCKDCPLQNDYCQFFARVERSKLLRQSKSGTLPYEDEKYFYLLLSKENVDNIGKSRIIRRPLIRENEVELKLCGKEGVKTQKFTKRNKEEFKKAKKSKINYLI